jgi:hypothetical protein
VSCDRCGMEVPTESVRVYESTEYAHLNLCEPCRTLPSGVLRTNEGIALSMAVNLILQALGRRADDRPPS